MQEKISTLAFEESSTHVRLCELRLQLHRVDRLSAGIAPAFSMNVHFPSLHTLTSISIRFSCTYCSGVRPMACR